jgi:hypothetical protein
MAVEFEGNRELRSFCSSWSAAAWLISTGAREISWMPWKSVYANLSFAGTSSRWNYIIRPKGFLYLICKPTIRKTVRWPGLPERASDFVVTGRLSMIWIPAAAIIEGMTKQVVFYAAWFIQSRFLTSNYPLRVLQAFCAYVDSTVLIKPSYSPSNPPNHAPTLLQRFSSPPLRRHHSMASVRMTIRTAATLRSSHRSSSTWAWVCRCLIWKCWCSQAWRLRESPGGFGFRTWGLAKWMGPKFIC